jgi:hypothetical protein
MVFLTPWLIPDDIIIMLTGPGEIDMASENENMAKSVVKVIYTPFLQLYAVSEKTYCTKLSLYSFGVVATIFKKFL